MLNWEGPVAATARPSERVERELRYRAAAPLIASAAIWCDLSVAGGGPPDGLGDGPVLVVEPGTDLTGDEELARVRAALLETEGDRVVTCFDTVERLATFVPLLRMLTEVAERDGVTVVLGVPNDDVLPAGDDARTVWGPAAAEELRRLLPSGAVVAEQRFVAGSLISVGSVAPARELPLAGGEANVAPTHLLVAFGPQAARLAEPAAAAAEVVDALAERAATRRREARLEVAEAAVRDLTAEVEQLRGRLRSLGAGGSDERRALDRA